MTADLSVYFVTDPVLCGRRGVVETVRQAVDGGVRIVQVRDKEATDADITALLIALSETIGGRALLVVNDRLDAALAARTAGARVDGVHLGQGDVSVLQARAALGPDAIVGLTANTAEHLAAVEALPHGTVDYLGVGVIRPTDTKPDHPAPLGIAGFRAFAAATDLPCVAIGGVGIDDVVALREAGAAGVAVVSALCAADDPAATAREFVRRWRARPVPRVLSIAGSDPSGGAGIQADLKSIAANGGYGMAAITALTAQNTSGVRAVHVPPATFLRTQLDAISDDITVDAVKIGMLGTAEVARIVDAWLAETRPAIVVIDPVMVSTSGDRLLDSDAETALRALLRRADLITPNLAELAVLIGREPRDWDDAVDAAQALASELGVRVLVKGGHLGGTDAPDVLVDARERRVFSGPRIPTRHTHGTGCSLSSALATRLALGDDPTDAVGNARAWLRESLRHGAELVVGQGSGPIHHFAGLWERGGIDTSPLAEEIAQSWWHRVAIIRADIDTLDFIRALADGTLARERFVGYLAQDALYLRDYARVLAEASRLAPDVAAQAFWAGAAQRTIDSELDLHTSWLGTAGHPVGPVVEPSAATVAYLDHLRAIAFDGDYATLVAALLPCFWLYADLAGRLRDGELASAGRDPRHPYASWVDTYVAPGFVAATGQAIRIVTQHAADASPVVRERMFDAFTRSCLREQEFFNGPFVAEG